MKRFCLLLALFIVLCAVGAYSQWEQPSGGGGSGGTSSFPASVTLGTYCLSTDIIQVPNAVTGATDCVAGVRANGTGYGDWAVVSNPELIGETYLGYTTTSWTSTQNINIDGASYADYNYSPGTGTAGAWTTVITSPPSGAQVRYITLNLGGGTNGATVTWTGVSFMGASGSTTVTASKFNHYACKITASAAFCSIIAEGSTY